MCMPNYIVQRFFHDAGVLAVTQLRACDVHYCILTPDCGQVLRVTFYIRYLLYVINWICLKCVTTIIDLLKSGWLR